MISHELNSKILSLAPKFTASDYAPSTYAELKSNNAAGLVVWSGASDNTIYGCNRVNHAFRAWHDSLHLKLGVNFDYAGELAVGLEQARLIKNDALGLIIMGEVVGQVEYLNKYGHFPIDQVEFMRNYLKGII